MHLAAQASASALRARIWLIGKGMRVLAMLTAAAFGACALDPYAAQPTPPDAAQSQYQIETIAEGLEFPWSIAFLPGGDILVTERPGRLRLVRKGKLVPEPIAGVPAVRDEGAGGLMDVVTHPKFRENRLIYLSYSTGDHTANGTQVARARLEGGALKDLQVIFEARPRRDLIGHYGGRLLFRPDGTLLLGLGDGIVFGGDAQDLQSHLGKIIRLNDDGSTPADNPFVNRRGAKPEIWSYGHRNVQGLAIHPRTGALYNAEHGPRGGDELNLIEPGKNYGWPVITWGRDYDGTLVSPYTAQPGMEQPLVHWTPSIAPSSLEIYDGALFPQWRGSFFASALALKHVRRVSIREGGQIRQERLFAELEERIRLVKQGPDGSLYLLTDGPEGKLLKVTPARR